jgi:hypothetical protein
MMRVVVIATVVMVSQVAAAVAQVAEPASPAQIVLQQPPAVELPAEESAGNSTKRSGWYAAGGVLVAAPMFFDGSGGGGGATVLTPLPSPWAALGYRGASDVSWQTSFLLVPLYVRDDFLFNKPYALSAIGFDIDRISTNRSETPGLDLRWQVGLRTVGAGFWGIPLPLGIGPHVGLRAERQMDANFALYGWGDVGVLPTFASGMPLLDLRAEIGLKWRPAQRPNCSVMVGAFNEYAGVVNEGFMTPGITVKVALNF